MLALFGLLLQRRRLRRGVVVKEMSASAFERGPRRESVSFDDGPLLVAQRQSSKVLCSSGAQIRDATGTAPGVDVVGPHDHEDEDDSVAIVFSGDTGAGRAHTPQRLNRTNTPQRSVSVRHDDVNKY